MKSPRVAFLIRRNYTYVWNLQAQIAKRIPREAVQHCEHLKEISILDIQKPSKRSNWCFIIYMEDYFNSFVSLEKAVRVSTAVRDIHRDAKFDLKK